MLWLSCTTGRCTHFFNHTPIHTHTCTHTYTHMHTHTYTHTHTHTCTHTYTHTHTHTCTHDRTYMRTRHTPDALRRYVLKCILKVVRGRTSNLPLVISLAYGLAQYYEPLGVGLVDGVLENIRAALEAPHLSSYQVRSVGCVGCVLCIVCGVHA